MNGNEMLSEMQYAAGACTNVSEDAVFHAVYIPQDNDEPLSDSNMKENNRVYQSKVEALKVIKAFKTGRLKTFKTRVEAEEFAKTGYEKCSINHIPAKSITPVVEEKTSNFKGPRPQELVCFRKLIESGDLEAVRSIVWGNPKYLISSGDTPAVLQEGCRYNALHVAVKSERPEMCELILNTVGDANFIRLLYGEEDSKSYLDRAEIMLDLYLNTPDKGLNETPLHFAVKFGLRDVVRVLVSYPQCEKKLRNKYKQLPIDIVCARKCHEDESLKKEIRMLLEDQYYVPVLRSEDNTLQPVIGEPFSPTSPMSFQSDPLSPRVEVKAFAGPMTKSRALEFRKKWKTPPRVQTTPIRKQSDIKLEAGDCYPDSLTLRLLDSEKGLERIGRNLAEEYQVSWKEYWEFLQDFADFRSAEGLMKLEKYLGKKFKDKFIFSSNNCYGSPVSTGKKDPIEDEIEFITNQLKSCSCSDVNNGKTEPDNNLDISDEFFTPPSSPKVSSDTSDDEMEIADEGFATYLEGPKPTKLDRAVFNALPATIDLNTHPNVYRWQHDMRLATNRDSHRSKSLQTIRKNLLTDY